MTTAQPLSESDFTALNSRDFWLRLAPDFAVTERLFDRVLEKYAIAPDVLESARATLSQDGYLLVPALLDPVEMRRSAALVQVLTAAGLPPPFALIYDEIWLMFSRLSRVFEGLLGGPTRVIPDYWIWQVDGRYESEGWSWHRDDKWTRRCFDAHGAPLIVTVWIPFTDATLENGCMYVVPQSQDPSVPGDLANFEVGPELEARVKALPAPAGSLLAWNSYVLHAGGAHSSRASGPRISIGMYVQAANAESFDGRSIEEQAGLPFVDRLGIVARMILRYADSYDFPSALLERCREWAMFYELVTRQGRKSRARAANLAK